MAFWMVTILNPSIQKKAQAELDAVVGNDRLPTNKDKADLPYIRSIMAEVARWAPPVPLCLSYLLSKVVYQKLTLKQVSLTLFAKTTFMRGMIFQKDHPSCPTSGAFLTANKKVFANQFSRHMLHDPDIYPNPMEFNPDRFNGLDSEMKKATNPIFGFGRRLCAGMHFA